MPAIIEGSDLQGREWPVAIDKIVEEDVGDSDKLVAHFVGRRKTLPLNKGHIAILSQAFGENPANCSGRQVILYPRPPAPRRARRRSACRIKLPQLQSQAAPPPPQPQPPPPAMDPEDEIPFERFQDGRGIARRGRPHPYHMTFDDWLADMTKLVSFACLPRQVRDLSVGYAAFPKKLAERARTRPHETHNSVLSRRRGGGAW